MVHEVAIDPSEMSSVDRVIRLITACGAGQPRLIAKLAKDSWMKAAIRSCILAGCQTVALKRVEVIIENAIKQRRFISRDRKFSGDRWIDSALREHARLPFRAIVANSTEARHSSVLDVEADLETNTLWNVPRSTQFDRTLGGYIDALGPMLRLARSVIIVEPNFDVGNKAYTSVIRALLREAAQHPPTLTSFDLHVTKRFDRMWEHLNNVERQTLEQMVPTGVTSRIFLWEKDVIPANPASDRLHDRFLLTDSSGITLGWGFDLREGSRTSAALLEDTTCREIENDLSNNSRRFRIASNRPIEFLGAG